MPTETIDVNGLKQESTRSFTINEAVHDFNNLNDPSNVESSSFSTPTLEPGFMEPSPPLRYERYSYTPGQATKITRFSYSQTNPKPTKVFLPFSENSGTVESSSTQSKLNDTAPEGIDLISKIEKNSISNQGLNHAFNSMSIENQNAKTDLIDHPEIKDSSIYTSNSPPSIVKTQREEINKDEKKPIDGPSMKKTTSIKKPRSHNRKNKSKDENLEDSTIIPINFVPLSNIKHHKSKTSRAMSSEELKELEKNGAKKKKDFSLNQDHRQDGIYSFSELSHDFLKTKVIATRAQSASNLISSSSTKPSVTPRSSDLNTNQKKRPSLHDGSASDLVHFQIDASHKVIFTCLSTLPIETELKNQVEELLRNQMAFIHEAYNVQNENFNLRLKTKNEEIKKNKEDLRNLKSKLSIHSNVMSGGYKNVPTKQTPVGSLLELCNSVKGSLENVSFKTSRTKEDFEGILKENEQLRGYLESLISRILEYPEALDVLSVSPLT